MARIKLKIQWRDWNEISRAKFADWNVSRHAYSSLLRKKAWRLLCSGREKQYKSYYPLRGCLCGKILSPRLEGLGLAMSAGFLSEKSAPKEEGDGNGGVIQRWCFSVDDRHPSPSRWFHQYLHARNTLGRAYMCACLPSEFSHHSVSPWLLEVATSNYPAESSSSNYRRPPLPPSLPPRHCYGFFVVTLLLRATRTVSWLTRYTRIYSLR